LQLEVGVGAGEAGPVGLEQDAVPEAYLFERLIGYPSAGLLKGFCQSSFGLLSFEGFWLLQNQDIWDSHRRI
jgi:hypothetical protein